MISKSEFLDALKREARITTHLVGKLSGPQLEFRFSPPQRSTLELLQYLTIGTQASVAYHLSGNWDHWDALEAQAKEVTQAGFAKAMAAQTRAVAKLLAPISDRAFATRLAKSKVDGKARSIAASLFLGTLTQAIGYRMQLFLQAKAAGHPELNSKNLWAGKDGKVG
jgi:hypothetical protein